MPKDSNFFQTTSVKPGDPFFLDYETTSNDLVERSRRNSPHMTMLLLRREDFFTLLRNKTFPSKIIAENMSSQEVVDFFEKLAAVFEINNPKDLMEIKKFFNSSEMRVRGKSHVFKMLREYPVPDAVGIRDAILACLREG